MSAQSFPVGWLLSPLFSVLPTQNKQQHKQIANDFPKLSKTAQAENPSETGHPKIRPVSSTLVNP